MTKQLLYFLPFLFLALFGYGQGAVTGIVTDQDGLSVISGTVAVQGTTKGTITDFDGKYTINNLSPGPQILIFSYVGYQTVKKEVTIVEGETITLDVTLKENSEVLDEVVVVGYGVQRKREVVGKIETVEGERLLETSTPSFEAALQGQAAGVAVIQGSGLAGSGSVIRIRGISSISASGDPLYVVDGIPITADNFLAEANWQNGAFNNNPLAVINPADIESIEILKDAAAAGIYGSRGANGVILITTKKGKSKKPTFNFTAGVGTSDPVARPDFLNGQEWLQLRQEAWENDGNTGAVWIPNYTTESDDPEARAEAYQRASQYNTDWWELLTRTGIKQDYNLSSTFGIGDRVNVFASLGYSDNESYLIGNSFRRYNARLNFDANITKNLRLSVNSSYNKGINERVRVSYTGGLGDAMSVALPIYPVYDSTNASGYWRGFNASGAPNPLFTNDHFTGFTIDDRILSTAQLVFTPTDRLSFTVSGGYDYLLQNNDFYESALLRQNTFGRIERDVREVTNYNGFATGQYDILNGDEHNLTVMAGVEYQQTVTSGMNNLQVLDSTFTKVNDFVQGPNGSYTYDSLNATSIQDEIIKFASLFTRINYQYKNKYILQLTARTDGSSKFGPDRQFGFFPTASAGWIISDEPFFNSSIVNFLKLKAGFGILGNSNIPPNQFASRYNTQGQYNGLPIRYPLEFANSDLGWESTYNFDAGITAGFWNDKVQLELGYYRKNTVDVLMGLTLPAYTGPGSAFFDNVGEILNEGIEMDLTLNNYRKTDFSWTTNLNLAYNYNEVISIGQYTEDAVSGGTNDTRVVEGTPVGTNFLIPYLGVDPETGRPIYLNSDGTPTFEYDEENDRRAVGDVLPDFVGGMTNTFTYKNFDLSFLFVFSVGADIYDSSSKRQFSFLTDWNVDRRALDRWTPENRDARYPIPSLDPAAWGNDKEWFNTDLWLQNASYIRLRNVNFGYNIPSEWIGGVNAKLIFSATNLLTLTNFGGLDPEVARDFDNVTDRNLSPNITFLTPPQERAFNFRLNVNF